MLVLVAALAAAVPSRLAAQGSTIAATYGDVADRIYRAATGDSLAYIRLGRLVDTFGHRLSGSPSLEAAIDWILAEMSNDGLENVRGEPVMVPRWVRGPESAVMIQPRAAPLRMLGLGGSVATPKTGITAPVLVVSSFDELAQRAAEAKGKIVLFDAPFSDYIASRRIRTDGPSAAARAGALACLIRSVASASIRSPHTGVLRYDSTVAKIPAAALSVEDAMMLHRFQDRGERVIVTLRMSARHAARHPVAQRRGGDAGPGQPDEVVVLGGHIDSWDVGQGAMDDGGGSVAAWEAVRLLHRLGLRPRRTVRVVLWTNEENGGAGGIAYRDAHASELAGHVLAMESDNGAFNPKGYIFAGSDCRRERGQGRRRPARLGRHLRGAEGPGEPRRRHHAAGGAGRAGDGARCRWEPVLLVSPQRRRHPRQDRSGGAGALRRGDGRDGVRRGGSSRAASALDLDPSFQGLRPALRPGPRPSTASGRWGNETPSPPAA